jgi:hypothetical protein
MRMIAGMIIAVVLMGIGFYARGACQPMTMQTQPDIQVASINNEAQDAFTHMADHLNGVRK